MHLEQRTQANNQFKLNTHATFSIACLENKHLDSGTREHRCQRGLASLLPPLCNQQTPSARNDSIYLCGATTSTTTIGECDGGDEGSGGGDSEQFAFQRKKDMA